MKKLITIGGDHAGFHLKEKLKEILSEQGYECIDHGPYSEQSVDYPDFVHPVCNDIIDGKSLLGLLICGSGNGVAITANKYSGVRCALCWNSELAALARQHNNANILALPARFITAEQASEILVSFLGHSFEGGRHKRRVDKMVPDTHYLC